MKNMQGEVHTTRQSSGIFY